MNFDSVVHAFLLEALTGRMVSLYGDGSQSRAFVELDQVLAGIVQNLMGSATCLDSDQFLADFQLSINDLLTWLRERLPHVEYRYHTPNVPLPSQTFLDVPRSASPQLDDCLEKFRNLLTLQMITG